MTSPVCYWTLKAAQGDFNQSVSEYVMFVKNQQEPGGVWEPIELRGVRESKGGGGGESRRGGGVNTH